MEKRSSIKDSALRSLFSVTESVNQAPGQPGPSRERERASEAVPKRFEGAPAGRDEVALDESSEPRRGRIGEEQEERGVRTDEGRRSLIQPSRSPFAMIRVVGVGGAGTNAVNRMIEAGIQGVEFVAINTDVQALSMCEAEHKLRIGKDITRGLGGGNDPKVGRDAAMAAYDDIKGVLKGSDMVFVTAGEGGGTGTGASPIVAEIARALGALTIGVVTFPFSFEGKRRGVQALEGVRALKQRADTVIVVPNQKLLEVSERGTSMVAALRVADDVLRQGVQAVCDLVTVPGLINLDLADVRTVMTGAGTAHMGVGKARGEERAPKAAEMALRSALLDTSIEGARGILINISGGRDLTLHEITEVADTVAAAAEPDATLIFGAVVDEELNDTVCVTVVAAGFDSTNDGLLAAQVEGTLRPVRRPEPREPERRHPDTRFREARPPERKHTTSDYGEVSWERSKEPASTPRRRPDDDDLDVPSFLR